MNKRLLFVVSEDWYFVSHRLHLAKTAIDNGFVVSLICNVSNHREKITSAGIELFDWKMSRGSVNPFRELGTIYRLFKLIKQINPDIIHVVTLKLIVYCAIISKFSSFKVVNALGGLGFVFSAKTIKAKFLQKIAVIALKFSFSNRSVLILQNKDDEDDLLTKNIIGKSKIKIIRGAGVDTDHFIHHSHLHKNDIPLVILPARMLWDKGVHEFIECAKKINKQEVVARFALVGGVDGENPKAVPKKYLEEVHAKGIINWMGYQNNMLAVYQQADIVCFPSYAEGLPKSLLESASCELPIVAFNVRGCREVVVNNINGFLVEPHNQEQLCNAVKKLITNKKLRENMGKKGREIVVNNFSQEQIGEETLQLWYEVLS